MGNETSIQAKGHQSVLNPQNQVGLSESVDKEHPSRDSQPNHDVYKIKLDGTTPSSGVVTRSENFEESIQNVNQEQNDQSYTSFSITKQKVASSQSLQSAKNKLISTIGNLKATPLAQKNEVSDIYYVNNEYEVQKYKEMTEASELEELKKEVQRTPDIPLLLEDSRVSDSILAKVLKKTIQNVLSVSESSTSGLEELNPKVLSDIIAEFESKALLGYRNTLQNQLHITSQCKKENLQISSLSNKKLKSQLACFNEFGKLRNSLQKASDDINRIMNLFVKLELSLPENVKENIDTIPFEAIMEVNGIKDMKNM